MPTPDADMASREETLFDEALNLPPDQRPAYLDRTCGGDPMLRARVEGLLKAHNEAGDLLEPPSLEPGDFPDSTPPASEPNSLESLQNPGRPAGRQKTRLQPRAMSVLESSVWNWRFFGGVWKLTCGFVLGFFLLVSPAQAQWLTQTIPLKPGWNAVFLHVDASHQTLDELIPDGGGIGEIWLWKPKFSTMQFIDSPAVNNIGNSQWSVWTSVRGDTDTLVKLVPNGAYLVYNRTATDYSWSVKGKPVPPAYQWTTTGLNFLGFPTPADLPPTLTTYLKPAPGLDFDNRLQNGVRIFRYPGGQLGTDNPVEINATTASAAVRRGEAFWVRGNTNYYNRYYGPVEVSLQNAAGIHYGDTLGTYSLRLKNLTTSSRTVKFGLVSSESPVPTGQQAIAGAPPLLLRGAMIPGTLNYSHTVLTDNQQFTLPPQGQVGSELEVVLGVNRSALAGAAGGSLYANILRITDTDGLQQIDVPVTATVPDPSGLWVGQASVDRVGEYLKQFPKADTETTNQTQEINRIAGLAGKPVLGAELPGSVWVQRESGIDRAYTSVATSLDGRRIIASVFNGTLLVSTNYGASFIVAGPSLAKAWGDNLKGQTSIPPLIASYPIKALAAGDTHSLALTFDGRVIAWGNNNYSQATVPAGLSGVTAIAAGLNHSLALKADGTVVAWGNNASGQSTVPVGLSGVISLAAGFAHSVALKRDGTIVVWGDNTYGQRVVSPTLSQVVAIVANSYHTVALKVDGTVMGWGLDGFGAISGAPPGLNNVIAIAGGWEHTLALKRDGTVVAWGYNAFGQTNVPSGLTGVKAIAANGHHSVALKNDGTVVAWGLDQQGQTTIPSNLGTVSAIGAGARHTLALSGPQIQSYTAIACSADASVIIAAAGTTLFVSSDSGVTWSARDTSLGVQWSDVACSADGQKMVAVGAGKNVYTSFDQGRTWIARDLPRNWAYVATSADGARMLAAVNTGQLFVSTNSGVTWAQRTQMTIYGWRDVASSADGTNLVAIADRAPIFVSTNAGLSWISRETPRAWTSVASSSDGKRLAATVANGGIYVSRDAGVTWELRTLPTESRNWRRIASSGDGTWLVAAVDGGQLYTLNRRFADYSMDPSTGVVTDQDGAYVSSGVDTRLAKVASPFPLRLILHQDSTAGKVSLLQRVYVGQGANSVDLVVANQERSLNPASIASARRITATHLPFSITNTVWSASGNFNPGSILNLNVSLDYNDHASNPFLHTFHPDHDNLDPDFKKVRPIGDESYGVTRDIKLTFNPPGSDFSSLTANAQRRSGTYEESMSVVAKAGATRQYKFSGKFTLQRISAVPTLTLATPTP
jgi:alpha-tubulin suppressor-like RCC1 family protein